MINLFVNYYKDKHLERQKELDYCLNKNLSNDLLNVVILESQERMKYNDYFKLINNYTSENDVNIISNSDIYFDDTVKFCSQIKYRQVYALSRWDLKSNGNAELFNRKDSQDAWIFKGRVFDVDGDFYLGWRGCDNRIAYEFYNAGYDISNPSLTIKSYHLHLTGLRNYTTIGNDSLVPGPYHTIEPSELK